MRVDITARSLLTGVERTKSFEMTAKQFADYKKNELTVQTIFPEYTPAQREFLITGIAEEEWEDE